MKPTCALVVNPPIGDLTMPSLGAPSVLAFLRKICKIETTFHDLNLEFVRKALTTDNLLELGDALRSSGAEVSHARSITHRRVRKEALAILPYVIDNIEAALTTLRDPELFSHYPRYRRSVCVIELAFQVISARFYPTTVGPTDCAPFSQGPPSDDDLKNFVSDPSVNPFLDSVLQDTAKLLNGSKRPLVCISVTFASQLYASLTLAAIIKEANQHAVIVVGGQIATLFQAEYATSDILNSWVDFWYSGDAECVLDRLVFGDQDAGEAPRRETSLSSPPRSENSWLTSPTEIASLPVPDFGDTPWDSFLSPTKVIPYSITRGCPWNRCAFCSYSLGGLPFVEPSLDKVESDLRHLKTEENTELFMFAVNDVPPEVLRLVVARLRIAEEPIIWWCEQRLESGLSDDLVASLYETGCRFIVFGLESGSDRLLTDMRKGITTSNAEKVISRCHRHGITVNVQVIIGFPTETGSDVDLTVAFLEKNRERIMTVSAGPFQLQRNSPMSRDPESFGISKMSSRHRQFDSSLAFEPKPKTLKQWPRILRRYKRISPEWSARFFPNDFGAHAFIYAHWIGADTLRRTLRDYQASVTRNRRAFVENAAKLQIVGVDEAPVRKSPDPGICHEGFSSEDCSCSAAVWRVLVDGEAWSLDDLVSEIGRHGEGYSVAEVIQLAFRLIDDNIARLVTAAEGTTPSPPNRGSSGTLGANGGPQEVS